MIFLRVFALSMLWKGVLGAIEDYTLTVSPVTVQEGLCVLIPCQFTIEPTEEAAESPRGYWFFEREDSDYQTVASNDGTRGIRADTKGRFKLVGDLMRRDCSLRIDDVRRSDGRNYYFKYEHRQNSRIKFHYIFFPLRVTVVDLQDKPEIVVQSALIEGREGQVYCMAPGRCSGTPPTITWSGDLNSVYATSNYSVDNNDGSQSHKSKITFIVTMRDNRKHLKCTAHFSTVGASTTANVSLLIENKPRLAAYNSSSCQSVENATMCICVVEANPPPTIEWKINENTIPESFQNGSIRQAFFLHDAIKNSTLFMNISDSASLSIACIFSNKHGRGAQILMSPGGSSTSKVSIGAIAGIAVATTLLLVLLVGVSLCVTRKIRKRGSTGSRTVNEASNGTTVDSTYQELQRRQSDTYCELKRD